MCASTHAVACACVHVCGCVRVCACEASSIKVSLMLLTIFKSHMVGQYIFILHYLFPPSDFSVTRSHIHISKDRQLSSEDISMGQTYAQAPKYACKRPHACTHAHTEDAHTSTHARTNTHTCKRIHKQVQRFFEVKHKEKYLIFNLCQARTGAYCALNIHSYIHTYINIFRFLAYIDVTCSISIVIDV